MGIQFFEVDAFLLKMRFENCQLRFSSFRELHMQHTVFKNCQLEHVEFASANLKGSVFDNSNLKHVIFEETNLEKVDFSLAFSLSIDPDQNRLKGAIFTKYNCSGLLHKI